MRNLFLFISLLVSQVLTAGPISRTEAQQKAGDFLRSKTGRTEQLMSCETMNNRLKARGHQQSEAFYVFNVEGDEGFVIVSGDSRTEEILGYATTGHFDADNLPDNMADFLEAYAEAIGSLPADIPEREKADTGRKAAKTSVAPLIATRWGQDAPFNAYCPSLPYNGGLVKSVTGCVSTLMAQIMAYHRWPEATTAHIPAYSFSFNDSKVEESAVPAGTTIDWANIKNSYGTSYQGTESENAVAQLMHLCGDAVKMEFSLNNSAAKEHNALSALATYFDYDATTARYVNRKDYSYDEWQDIIYNELKAGRPVIYGGRSLGGGHAFICDGYDKDDFFHINWGWRGTSDGYFRLRLLAPASQGIGGSSTNDGYGINQSAGIGIQRNSHAGVPYVGLVVTTMRPNAKQVTRTAKENDFMLSFQYSLSNYGFDEKYALAIQVVDADMGEKALITGSDLAMPNGYSTGLRTGTAVTGKNLADGRYEMRLVCKPNGTGNWRPCQNTERHHLGFTISDNTLTFDDEPAKVALEMVSANVEKVEGNSNRKTIRMTFRNNGTTFRDDIYYQVNNVNVRYACAYLEIESGKTGEISFPFSANEAGDYLLTILTGSENRPIGEVNVTIVPGKPEIKVDELRILDMTTTGGKNVISGNTLRANVTISNKGDGNYKGSFLWQRYVHSVSDGKWHEVLSVVNEAVSLEPGDVWMTTMSMTNQASDEYDLYKIEFYYSDKDGNRVTLGTTPEVIFDGNKLPEIEVLEAVIDDFTSEGDMDYVNSPVCRLFLTLKNVGEGNYEGQLETTYTYYNAETGAYRNIYPQREIRPFELEVGATVTMEAGYFEDPQMAENYRIRVAYRNNGRIPVIYATDPFAFRYVNGIREVDADTTDDVFYDMLGRRLTQAPAKGVFIQNGKKVIY